MSEIEPMDEHGALPWSQHVIRPPEQFDREPLDELVSGPYILRAAAKQIGEVLGTHVGVGVGPVAGDRERDRLIMDAMVDQWTSACGGPAVVITLELRTGPR